SNAVTGLKRLLTEDIPEMQPTLPPRWCALSRGTDKPRGDGRADESQAAARGGIKVPLNAKGASQTKSPADAERPVTGQDNQRISIAVRARTVLCLEKALDAQESGWFTACAAQNSAW
ncbi:hypothetical protein, partial [Hyphomonas sp.]|uniref:hypothetical protein n=1 Tax=Hyphomonas sp. TaxID=87 RepID=UPI0032990261